MDPVALYPSASCVNAGEDPVRLATWSGTSPAQTSKTPVLPIAPSGKFCTKLLDPDCGPSAELADGVMFGMLNSPPDAI